MLRFRGYIGQQYLYPYTMQHLYHAATSSPKYTQEYFAPPGQTIESPRDFSFI